MTPIFKAVKVVLRCNEVTAICFKNLNFFFLQNLSGTIVAIINIITVWVAPNPRTAAIYYFITALFILLACFDTYFALPLNVSLRVYGADINDVTKVTFL